MITKFTTKQAYTEASYPTDESRVAQVLETNEIMIDGVNVVTDNPTFGDAVYVKGDDYYFVKGKGIQPDKIPNDFTCVGTVYSVEDDEVALLGNTTTGSFKYCDLVKWAITSIDSSTIKFKIYMADDYSADSPSVGAKTITVSGLTAGVIDLAAAAAVNTALNATGNTTTGYTNHLWWAYLADDNNNKVDSNGTRIIVQCDMCYSNNQLNPSNTVAVADCTFINVSWGGMPAINTYIKNNGSSTTYRGLMNLDKGYAYWKDNGRTPTADVQLPESGDIDPLNSETYYNNAFCAAVRAKYGNNAVGDQSYKDYIKGEFGILYPQKQGAFTLPDGKFYTKNYGDVKTVVNDNYPSGRTDYITIDNQKYKYNYPALHSLSSYGNNNYPSGLKVGEWFMIGIKDGMTILNSGKLDEFNAIRNTLSISQFTNSSSKWFAQRRYSFNAWYFSGTHGTLYGNSVNHTYSVWAVSLLKIKH